jgi:hypothetical protein
VEDEAVRLEARLALGERLDRGLAREEQRERPLERELDRVAEERLAKGRVVEPTPFDEELAVPRAGANGCPAAQVDGRLLTPTA